MSGIHRAAAHPDAAIHDLADAVWDVDVDGGGEEHSPFELLGNGAMLALAGEIVALNATKKTDIWMGAFVTVPQIVMALIGPLVGKIADQRGRKPILVFGFIFLPLRAALFALTRNPEWLAVWQILDGLAAGVFLVVGVLMIADCTEGTGHYNFALGTAGAAVGTIRAEPPVTKTLMMSRVERNMILLPGDAESSAL